MLVPVAVALAVVSVSIGVYGLFTLREATLGPRLAFDDAAAREQWRSRRRVVGFVSARLMRAGDALAPRVLAVLGDTRRESLDHRLAAAGRPNGWTLDEYVVVRIAWVIGSGGVGVLLLAVSGPVAAVLAFAAGLVLPEAWLSRARRVRQHEIDATLPDFLDILAVTVRAGTSVRGAIARVADALDGPLSEELETTLRRLDFGMSTRDAFENLRDRNDSDALGRLVAALLQAEELGAPLADALQGFATEMRRSFHQDARRRAAKAAPRVSLITVTVILPGAVLLILAGLVFGSGVDFGDFLS